MLLKNTSISNKLRIIITTTCCALLISSTSIYFANHAMQAREQLVRDLHILARVVADNSSASVIFDDFEAASQVLDALSAEPDIVAAITLNNMGMPLGEFRRDESAERLGPWEFGPTPDSPVHKFHPGFVDIATPITLEGKQLGLIVLRSNMAHFNKEIRNGVTIVIVIAVLATLVAFLMSSWLQRIITAPILTIADTMRRISREKRFNHYVKKDHDDEVGALIDSFNDMIVEIGDRDQKLLERRKQIEYLAYYDKVTSLPNRAYVTQHLETVLARAKRNKASIAVLFIDLDRFKDINDTLGHAAGDELLRQVSNRLKKATRAEDLLASGRLHLDKLVHTSHSNDPDVVGRIGGDEFMVVADDIGRAEDAAVLAQRLLDELQKPFEICGMPRYINGSIGISVYPDDGDTVETLVKHADSAMYHGKQLGRGQYQFYIESINQKARERMALECDLRRAFEHEELEVWYQPRIDVRSREVISVEALVRWRHEKRGLVMPADFIPIAEESGLIVQLGTFVMQEACRTIKRWQEEGLPPISVSVNLSARQFDQSDLFQQIEDSLVSSSLDGRYLELEVTESMVMRDIDESIRTLSELRQLGVSVSIDDFGTGYSSLHRLKQLPIHALKIDRSFVRDMTSDPDTDSIVRAVIGLAHSLRLRVVAEGVENQAQLAALFSHDCDEAQGYLFSKPLPADEAGEWLREWQESIARHRSTSASYNGPALDSAHT